MRLLLVLAAIPASAALLPAVSRAACPTQATTADLAAVIAEAHAAYAEVDAEGFRTAAADVDATVPCVADGIARHLAAELHRHVGMAAFVAKDRARAASAFSAARGIEATWTFPDVMVPAGHPIARLYEESAPPVERIAMPAPAEGHVAIDGSEATTRAAGVPSVVQVYDAAGTVTTTAYVWPDDPWPEYAVAGGAEVAGGGEVVAPGRTKGAPRKWWIGTGIAALTTGVLYGATVAVHQQYEDADTPPEDLERLRTTNNALVVASGVGLGATIGLGTVALAVQF